MDLKKIVKSCGLSLRKYSPEVLTGLGIAGMISAIIITAKVSPVVSEKLKEETSNRLKTGKRDEEENIEGLIKVSNDKNGEYGHYRLPAVDILKISWKYYIPCVITVLSSGACIIGASVINHKRNAALATAFSVSELALKEYKEKVTDKIGQEEVKKIDDSIASDMVKNNPPVDNKIIDTGNGKTLFYDPMSATYFYSTMEDVKKAVNDTNKEMLHDSYVTVNQLLLNLDLNSILIGDEFGWDFDHGLIDISFSGDVVYDKKTSCIVLNYTNPPRIL
jgi:hypothetical protein